MVLVMFSCCIYRIVLVISRIKGNLRTCKELSWNGVGSMENSVFIVSRVVIIAARSFVMFRNSIRWIFLLCFQVLVVLNVHVKFLGILLYGFLNVFCYHQVFHNNIFLDILYLLEIMLHVKKIISFFSETYSKTHNKNLVTCFVCKTILKIYLNITKYHA